MIETEDEQTRTFLILSFTTKFSVWRLVPQEKHLGFHWHPELQTQCISVWGSQGWQSDSACTKICGNLQRRVTFRLSLLHWIAQVVLAPPTAHCTLSYFIALCATAP